MNLKDLYIKEVDFKDHGIINYSEWLENKINGLNYINDRLSKVNSNLKDAIEAAICGLEWKHENTPMLFDRADDEKLYEWKQLLGNMCSNYKNIDLSKDGAVFSENKSRRFGLWRVWDQSLPVIMFVGLNPSTADENNDDPTIRRVKRFAKDWGFGAVYMVNLFSMITPNPEILETDEDFEENDFFIGYLSSKISEVVFAWGSFKEAKIRASDVYKMFSDPKALHINADGSPKHPLYVKADKELISFKSNSKDLKK